jgi:hypothetical protein
MKLILLFSVLTIIVNSLYCGRVEEKHRCRKQVSYNYNNVEISRQHISNATIINSSLRDCYLVNTTVMYSYIRHSLVENCTVKNSTYLNTYFVNSTTFNVVKSETYEYVDSAILIILILMAIFFRYVPKTKKKISL